MRPGRILRKLLTLARGPAARAARRATYPGWLAYEPALLPPPALMATEGIAVLEEWLRWGEEWSILLRAYGGLRADDAVLEIGCGLGRVAFPLRYLLSAAGRYTGFDITPDKIEFVTREFTARHPNFRFHLADVYNSHYNPAGSVRPGAYRFPAGDGTVDLVYAASVFTHMVPEHAAHYFRETARVLKPDGRALFSFFLLDHYRAGHPRPLGFAGTAFDFDHAYGGHGANFATVVPENPEEMTAYRTSLVERMADDAGLALAPPIPGLWSGTVDRPVAAQDLVVLTRSPAPA